MTKTNPTTELAERIAAGIALIPEGETLDRVGGCNSLTECASMFTPEKDAQLLPGQLHVSLDTKQLRDGLLHERSYVVLNDPASHGLILYLQEHRETPLVRVLGA